MEAKDTEGDTGNVEMKDVKLEDTTDNGTEPTLLEQSSNQQNEKLSPEEQTALIVKTHAERMELKLKQQAEFKRKRKEENEAYEKNLEDQRHKSLLHLLKESQFYAKIIQEKMNQKNGDENQSPRKRRRIQPKPKAQPKKSKSPAMRCKKRLSKEELETLMSDSDEENATSSDRKMNFFSGDHREQSYTPPQFFTGELRKYQIEGFQWLQLLHNNGINGILADEMGLGKTIQVIALLCHVLEMECCGPYLVIAPLSTLSNWMIEFERFAPQLKVVLFHGDYTKRQKLKKEMNRNSFKSDDFKTYPICLTSYEMVLEEKYYRRSNKWQYIVIDEAQRIKNAKSQLSIAVKSFPSLHRLLLTRTSLQNNLEELWALLNFLRPEMFNDLAVFQEWFDVEDLLHKEGTARFVKLEKEKKVISMLKEILKPFMLRRLKDEVCKDIPPKKEVVVYAPLSTIQRIMYLFVLNYDLDSYEEKEDLMIELPEGKRPVRKCRMKLENPTMEFTKVKTPLELRIEKMEKTKGYDEQHRNFLLPVATGKLAGHEFHILKRLLNHPYLMYWPGEEEHISKINEDMIKHSGKLMVLDQMLAKLYEKGHKILLFSTMTMVLDIIEDYLTMRPNYKYCRLDGSVHLEDRTTAIKDFNGNPDVFIFLATARAGGVGINLTQADTVIIYDSDWNPQVDLQAMARCHRIGQTKPVITYKLCAKGTLDERIISRSDAKRKLEKAVIATDIGVSAYNITKEGILDLLLLMESTDNHFVNAENNAVYSDAEMEKLLDRSDLWAAFRKSTRENASRSENEKRKPLEDKTSSFDGN